MLPVSRRELLKIGLAAGTGLALNPGYASTTPTFEMPPPQFTLSANIETLFPREMPRGQRIHRIAEFGLKAFSFWSVSEEDAEAMLKAQQATGLACGSIAGSGRIGWTTGLTKTGYLQDYLDIITENCEVARRFGAPNLVIFAGAVQKDISWERQYRQIISGFREAGDIAQDYRVYLCLEPLNPVESPEMSVLSAREGFRIIEEVHHPHVKLDFDMYHLQLGEGNLINNLKEGLSKGWIQFVEIGDVPGRKEPGTGEVNYQNIFNVLREAGYDGYVGMEHGSSSTPEHAMRVVQEVAGFVP